MWVSITLAFFILSIVLHSLACWHIRAASYLLKFMIAGTISGLLMMAILYSNYGFNIEFIAGTLAFAFACELYIFVFNFVATSVSVSILLKASQQDLDIKQLHADYSGESMVDSRIVRLQKACLLENIDGKLQVSSKGQKLIDRFNRLHSFFRLRESFSQS